MPRSFELHLPKHVHFLGICGRMVGGMALALKERGLRVSGSEAEQFPPMPDLLRQAGIVVHTEWSADHLPKDVDVVVMGAMLQRGNPELEAALKRGVPVWNSTAFLEHYFLQRPQNFVVAGTKGKTTTTAMLAWILKAAGLAPDYLIGGQVRGELERVRLTGAKLTVLEGDEYRCGLGDPMPKFLRYHARHVVLTNVRHDHHEIYPTQVSYHSVFWDLISRVPPDGSLIINEDDPKTKLLCSTTPVPVERVGFSKSARHRITGLREGTSGTKFQMDGRAFRLMLPGRMNAVNAALAAVAAGQAGVSAKDAAAALKEFPGVEGRMEVAARVKRSLIYTDDIYHPVASRAVLEALRKRHPRCRIVIILEPRHTGGGDGLFQRELPESLQAADLAILSPHSDQFRFEKPFDDRKLHRDLRKLGVGVAAFPSLDRMMDAAPALCRDGDVILISLIPGQHALTDQLCADMQHALLRKK